MGADPVTAWLPKRCAWVVIAFIAVQDTVYTLYNHHLFAQTSLCSNPIETEAGGPFARLHCAQHKYAAKWYSLNNLVSIFVEISLVTVLKLLALVFIVGIIYDGACTARSLILTKIRHGAPVSSPAELHCIPNPPGYKAKAG